MFKRKHRELPEFLQVPWGVREVLVYVFAWFGLQLAVGALLAVLGPNVPAVASFLKSAHNGDIAASFALDLVGVVIGFGIVGWYLRRYKVGWEMVGWRKVGFWRTAKYLIGILLLFIVLADLALVLVKFLVPAFNVDQPQTNDFTTAMGSNRSLALVALVIIPPIFEETIFRGFLFPALSKHGGVIWGAILSSVIFGVAHGQANLFIYTTILGLFLCFMYRRLGSIIPGIFLHMLNNYLAFLALSSK